MRFLMCVMRCVVCNSPSQGRDVFNEKPIKEAQKLMAQPGSAMGSVVTMHTTMGDITFELYPEEYYTSSTAL